MHGVQIWKPITVGEEMIRKKVSYHGDVPKKVSVGAEVTSGSRLFQRRLPK